MIVTIPSYHRAGQVSSLDFLGDAFSKEEIIIGTQCEEDYEAYTQLYGERATVIYRAGSCCSDNRNNLLSWLHEQGITECLQIDDDLKNIRTMADKRLVGKEFRELMERCLALCREEGVTLFSGGSTDNFFPLRKGAGPCMLVGMLLGFLDTSVRFDPKFLIKHDYELSLRLMAQGRKVIRFNSFGASAKHKSSGGCSDAWKRKDYEWEAQMLVEAFPQYVKLNPKKRGEILFIR